MTTRLSMSSLAGTARTLVAVGTCRLASMLVTTRAAGPRSGTTWSSTGTEGSAARGSSRGFGATFASGPVRRLLSGAAFASGAGATVDAAAGCCDAGGVTGCAGVFAAAGADWPFAAPLEAPFDDPFEVPFEVPFEAGVLLCPFVAGVVPVVPPSPGGLLAKYEAHFGSTDFGSARYCWYISSTSHSLGPKSEMAVVRDWSGTADTPLSQRRRRDVAPSDMHESDATRSCPG